MLVQCWYNVGTKFWAIFCQKLGKMLKNAKKRLKSAIFGLFLCHFVTFLLIFNIREKYFKNIYLYKRISQNFLTNDRKEIMMKKDNYQGYSADKKYYESLLKEYKKQPSTGLKWAINGVYDLEDPILNKRR